MHTNIELMHRVHEYVANSERKLQALKRLVNGPENARPYPNKTTTNAAEHAVQLLANFSWARRKRQAVFAWFVDAQRKQNRKSCFITINAVSIFWEYAHIIMLDLGD